MKSTQKSVYKHTPTLPKTTLAILSNYTVTNSEALCKFMLRRLHYAIEHNLDAIHLFYIHNSDEIGAVFKKEHYLEAIDAIYKKCKAAELYELMGFLNTLKDRHHANMLLDTTTTI